eukprot:gene7949-biopygen18090
MRRRRRRARDTGKGNCNCFTISVAPQAPQHVKCGELSSERSAILRDYPISPAQKRNSATGLWLGAHQQALTMCIAASVRDFHVVFTFLPSLHKWTTSVQVIKTRAKDNNDFCLVERSSAAGRTQRKRRRRRVELSGAYQHVEFHKQLSQVREDIPCYGGRPCFALLALPAMLLCSAIPCYGMGSTSRVLEWAPQPVLWNRLRIPCYGIGFASHVME